jgi:hypothetical protein
MIALTERFDTVPAAALARWFELTFTTASQVFHWTNRGELRWFLMSRRVFYAPTNAGP